jgi:hypothetical protein
MLKIAVIANTYRQGKQFIEYKFRGKIESVDNVNQTWILTNKDTVHLCYGDDNMNQFDAFVIEPSYTTLSLYLIHALQCQVSGMMHYN